MTNNQKIKDAGIAPWSRPSVTPGRRRFFVLADFNNVRAANPNFAEDYTEQQGQVRDHPEGAGRFEHLQDVNEAGYLNDDYASAKFADGVAAVATGKAAHYPMITFAMNAIYTAAPDNVDDVGFFAMPGDNADDNGATLWSPSGIYIPKTAEGDQLEAAKKFQAFLASPAGCEAIASAAPIGGPFAVKTCELPADVATAVEHLSAYVDAGSVTPALEFLSPIKGPALEQITVEVGSGIRGAKDGAELYDQDVEKQAQQLGLEGW